VARDRRTGAAETVLKGYLTANISKDAVTSRRIPFLNVETNQGRGAAVVGSARFTQLQTLFYPLAQTGGIGYDIRQTGTELEFVVYQPVDRSAEIRMDIANNRLSRTEYSYQAPQATRAIVGGAGESVERLFKEESNSLSLAAESVWGRRIERFVDARDAQNDDILTQRGQELLIDNGKTIVNLSVTPTDTDTMRYGFDWDLGDIVTVVVADLEEIAVVTEVGIGISFDGVRIVATVGTATPTDFETELVEKVEGQDARISQLERNSTGFGIETLYTPLGGTDGTQPTFDGDPLITGQYTRFGNMVHFTIQVDFDNILTFGTGQYFLTLPYASKAEYKFADGCLHQVSTGREYQIRGALLKDSDVLKLSTTDIVGQRIFDSPFTSTDPVTLTVNDFFHIAGTYEIVNGS
jgi:hypothetical protein